MEKLLGTLLGKLKNLLWVWAGVSYLAIPAIGAEVGVFDCDGLQITSEFERLVGNGASQYAHCLFRLTITEKSIMQQLEKYDLANGTRDGKLEVRTIDNCEKDPATITFSSRNSSYYESNLYDFTNYRIGLPGEKGERSLVIQRAINNTKFPEIAIELANCQITD